MSRAIVKYNGARALARKTKRKPVKQSSAMAKRGYREVASIGSANADWWINALGEDADLYQNAHLLIPRMRDLAKTNPIFVKYREMLWCNIFGPDGIMLRMKIKETEDRVIHTPDEKWSLVAWERRINRIIDWAKTRTGNEIEAYRAYKLAEEMQRAKPEDIFERKAIVQVGDSDVFANQIWERWWQSWQRAEFCDIRGRRNYHVIRQLRLWNAVRDGDFFIRTVMDPKVNAMGYTLQMISGEWCDRFFNGTLSNGNVVIMGIEYEMTVWGIGKPVAFYFIRRMPNDWQFTLAGGFSFSSGADRNVRVPADEIIHYARPVDADSTRPAPWAASCIPSSRQLDQAMLAEVIAWRESACKTGFYWSDVNPNGGNDQFDMPNPKNCPTEPAAPGSITALEFGVKYQDRNPTHPNANVAEFRKSAGRQTSAGMPGGDYNILFNDLENINFSAGRLGRLDTNAMSNMLQRFDIDVAERPIFERGMEMALIVGAVPFPNSKAKLAKFNKPEFQGPKQPQVDEVKAVNSAALRVANMLSSRNKECAERGIDFEDNLMELAEEEIGIEAFGLNPRTTVEHDPVSTDDNNSADDATNPPAGGTTKPTPTKKPKKQTSPDVGTNGNGNGNGSHKIAIGADDFPERINSPITIVNSRGTRTITHVRDEEKRIVQSIIKESDD